MQQRVSASPLWLSTAGMGVSWLHLRLDSRPKNYRHGLMPMAPDRGGPCYRIARDAGNLFLAVIGRKC